METTRKFDLGDILSITTGRLVSTRHMDGVYDILNYMTGDSLFTHQLPRAIRAARPVILQQHPQLAEIEEPEFSTVTHHQLRMVIHTWLSRMKSQYGDSLPLVPMADWESRNPLQELAEMVGPERIIVVEA